MRGRVGLTVLAVCAATLADHPVLAQEESAQDLGQFSVGAGLYEPFDDNPSAMAELEWRPPFRIFDTLTPIVGALVTDDGAAMGYAGIGLEINVGDGFMIMPFTSAGVYASGRGDDLGGVFELRSGVEASYEVTESSSVGLAFTHISNASIYDDNPGANQILLRFAFRPQ